MVRQPPFGYTYTYEINRLRDKDAGNKQNQYHYFFPWNYLNNGDYSNGGFIQNCWNIVQENGCPNFDTWGTPIPKEYKKWLSGYEKYDSSMFNRLDSYNTIFITDSVKLDIMKHWISDHNEGDTVGGLANFVAIAPSFSSYDLLPPESAEEGKWIIKSFGGFNDHAWTIVGYNDNIMFDFNEDDQFSNNLDITGDSIIDLCDWEIGAFKVANSWGYVLNSGYIFVPYRLFAIEEDSGGIKNNCTFIALMDTSNPYYQPQLVIKAKIQYAKRNKLRIKAGYANQACSTIPSQTKLYRAFSRAGGPFPMQGVNTDPIEIELDYSYWFNQYQLGKIFLIILKEPSGPSGQLLDYSVVDYRWGEEFEISYNGSLPVQINQDSIRLAIEYDLIPFNMFESPVINTYFDCNKICRQQCRAYDDAEVTFNNGITLDFYNGTLTIEEDAELILGDSVTLTAKRDADSLIVYGDLQIGRHVSFVAEGEASLVIDIRNPSLDLRIAKANFENIELIAQIDSLCIDSCTFTDSNIEFQRTNDQKFVISNSAFEDSYVGATVGEISVKDRGTVIITDCYFENSKNTTNQSVIDIGAYKNFVILRDSLLFNDGTGIKIHHSGSSAGQNSYIRSCFIENNNAQTPDSSVGIIIYHSYAEIELNHISEHNYGVACFDKSNVQLLGCDTAGTPANTQHIFDNLVNQVYAVTGSFPFEFEYNSIYNNQNSDTLVYYNTLFLQSPPPLDVRNNDWGGNSLDTNLLHPPGQYLWDPEWEPGGHKSMTIDKDLFYQAVQYIKDNSYADAESNFKEIIVDYPDSKYVLASVKELLVLKRIHDQDFAGLQTYLDSIPTLWGNDKTANVTEHVINWCNIEKEDFEEAITWFESQIEDPESYADSICAIIDLVYTYTLFDSTSNKSTVITSKFPEYRPLSKADYIQKRNYYTGLLFKKHNLKPKPDPENFENNISGQLKAFPNPFTNTITFQYYLTEVSFVKLVIYNGLGEQVYVIADEEQKKDHLS